MIQPNVATKETHVDVGVRDLKNNLSRHLKTVKDGETITVTEHGRPIARIEPIVELSRLEQMIADGSATAAKEPKGELPPPIKHDGGSILEFIEEQRG